MASTVRAQMLAQGDAAAAGMRGKQRMDWAEFALDQAANAGARVAVRQSDFVDGTLIVREPCWIDVVEDIVFSPNEADDSRPRPEQMRPGLYDPREGFVLGFFAAIVVTGRNVTIDLNGHELSQSALFRARQGFYAHISVSALPFIRGEGPAAFGDSLAAADHLTVQNGVLGLSSHHGIHGHGAQHVLLRNLEIREFEVACVSMNGWLDAYAHDVHCADSSETVPVRGTFTQARFMVQFLDVCAERYAGCADAAADLRRLMAHVDEDVAATGAIDAEAHPEAHALFASRSNSRLDGGTAYGWVITHRGATVHSFGSPFVEGEGSQRIVLERCSVRGVKVHPVEVISAVLDNEARDFVNGAVGDLFDFHRYFLEEPSEAQDALFQGQMALARAYWSYYSAEERAARVLGVVNIPLDLVEWYEADGSADDLASLYQVSTWRYQADADRQGHTPDGAFLMRIDSSAQIALIDVELADVHNSGAAGLFVGMPGQPADEVVDPATYTVTNRGHPLKGDLIGYKGADAHGLLVSGVVDIEYDSVRISDVRSDNGRVIVKEIVEL